jgi:L-lactate dehydrogenase
VFLQILDPEAFAGRDAFVREMDEVTGQCRAARPIDAQRPVRLPGEKGLQLAQAQREQGVALHPGILEALQPWAQQLQVALP